MSQTGVEFGAEAPKDMKKLRALRDRGLKKHDSMLHEMQLRQRHFFGETQHKFMKTTDKHGQIIRKEDRAANMKSRQRSLLEDS